jgi:GT2 family glycosyltransferase
MILKKETPKKTTRPRKTKNESVKQTDNQPVLGVIGNTLWILTNEEPTEREQTLTIDGFEKPFPIEWVEDRNAFLTELLMGYNLLENGDFSEDDKKSLKGWAIDRGQLSSAGIDLADEWQLTDGHTAFLLAAEDAPRPSFAVEQKIPVIADVEYKFSGYFATQRAEGLITLFYYDENHRIIGENKIYIANQSEYSGGTSLDNYALVEPVFTPISGTKYLQFKIELGEQIDLTQANGYLFFTQLFLGIYENDTESQFVKNYSVDAHRLNQAALEIKDSVFGKIDLLLFYEADQITIEYQNNVSKFNLDKKITSDYFRIRIAKACKNKNWAMASKQLEKWLDADVSSKELHIFTQIDYFGIKKKGIFDLPTVDALILVRQLSENRPEDFQVWLLFAEVSYSLQRWKECVIAYNMLKKLNHLFDNINSIRFGETLAELHHYDDAFNLYLNYWTQSFEDRFLNKCFEVVGQCDDLEMSFEMLSTLFKMQKQKKEVQELMIQIIPRLCVTSLANLLDKFGVDGYKLVLKTLPSSFENADVINDWTIPLTLLEALDRATLLDKFPDWLAVECVWMTVQLEKLLIISDKIFEPQYKQTLIRLKGLSIWSKVVEFDKNFPLLDTDYLVYGQSRVQKSFGYISCLSEFLAHPESKFVSPHILLSTNWQDQDQDQDQDQERLNQIRHVLIDFFRYSGDISEKTPNPNAYFDCDWYSENYLANNKEAHPLLHYLTHFEQENVQPSFYFNNAYVLEKQCLLSDEEPLSYYLKQLKKGSVDFCLKGFSPSPFFDREFYLGHSDILNSIHSVELDPLVHFILYGKNEGRKAYSWQEYNEFVRHQMFYVEPCNEGSHFSGAASLGYIKRENAEIAYFNGQRVLTKQLSYRPLISILVPVYQVNPRFLEEMIQSVIIQTYDNWQLCLVDDASKRYQTEIHNLFEQHTSKDARIVYSIREKNGHICNTTNDCIKLAKGDYLALLDHDDLLTPDALYEVVLALNNNQKLDILYSDEDKVDEWGMFCGPYYKPDWSPHSLWARMYTCHLSIYRKSLVESVDGLRVGYEGSQDHDLMLRCSEKTTHIHHIPKVLYHWRMHEESTAGASGGGAKDYCANAALKSVKDVFHRRGLEADVTLIGKNQSLVCAKPKVIGLPLVDIIIPSRNSADILTACLESIFEKSTYQNFKITVVDNGSFEKDFFTLVDYWNNQEPSRFQVIRDDSPFNFSSINNLAVQKTKGDYLLFLNNDTEVITEDWLEGMLGYAQLNEIGAVGVKLLYPDKTIQHAGIVTGPTGIATHVMAHLPHNWHGYATNLSLTTNYSAVTGACLMISREKFNAVDGFEEYLQVAFNDIDLCLKVREQGFYNVYLPFVELYHHESKSRGYENTPEKQERFEKEIFFMRQRWGKALDNDPFYSYWLTLKDGSMGYRFH